ncbi:hypothetical protein LP420_16445 [Massilia sp. B-10]|nr:hypothetical protein LP420_16445 [Massilia sp. B-10]
MHIPWGKGNCAVGRKSACNTWTETDGVEYTLIATDTWSGEKCEKDLYGGGSILYRDKIYSCASGFQLYPWGTENYCIGGQLFDAGKELGTPKVCEGNPCNVATGNKFQSEVDYIGPNAGGLTFVR